MQIDKPAYVFWPDLIRALSIFLVILIHAASPVMNAWDGQPLASWMAGNIYTSLARVCVPLLFMVSGYLLLNRRESISSFYVNRFRKVMVPFLVWSLIYLLWQNRYGNYTSVNAIKAMILSILTGDVYYHFWFLYSLLSIYLFVPLFQNFVNSADEQTLWYLGAVFFIFGPLLSFIQEDYLDFKLSIDIGFFTRYIDYFYFGYLLGRIKFSRGATVAAVLVFIGAVIYTVRVTYSASVSMGDYDWFYQDYFRLNIFLMTMSAFILLKPIGEKMSLQPLSGTVKAVQGISRASFGIYLVHAMILFFLRRGNFGLEISGLAGPAIYMIPATTLLTFLISWAVVALLRKIPYLRAIVP